MKEQWEIQFLLLINKAKLKKKKCCGLIKESIWNMWGWHFYSSIGIKCSKDLFFREFCQVFTDGDLLKKKKKLPKNKIQKMPQKCFTECVSYVTDKRMHAQVKVFRIIPEFRILRLTFHR